MVALVPVVPFTIALTVAVPVPTAVTTPLESTVTADGLLLLQLVTKALSATPLACGNVPVAVAFWVWPPIIVVVVNPTAIDEGVVLVTTTDGPAAELTARYSGVTAPSQMRNSYTVPENC